MMNLSRIVIAGLALLSVCNMASAQRSGRVGSIYNPDRAPISLTGSKAARARGDLVTVLIKETQNLKNEEKADLKTDSSLKKALLDFNIKGNAFSTLPSIETNSEDEFKGTAKIEKKGDFTARLTAMVVDTMPNGNLIVQGRREIRIDNEVKVIEFSGIVRRYDISQANTIESEMVADARVTYAGTGPLSNATRRRGFAGWLHSAINWLWPF